MVFFESMTNELTTSDEQNGFHKDGFGGVARRVESLKVYITFRPSSISERAEWGVYIKDGVAGGAFYRSEPPLVRCDTKEQALEVTARIFGICDSEKFAEIIFP